MILILGLSLIVYILFPIFGILIRINPFQKEGNLIINLFDPQIISSLLLSVQTATASTAICIVTGIPLAYLIARSNPKFTQFLRISIALPLAIPPLIAGALLLNVYGESSPLGMLAQSVGVRTTQSSLGIILAQVFVISPFVVLTASAGIEKVDRYYEYASRILGKGAALTFVSITIPLAAKEIVAGIVLAWIRALGEFGANVMMAYNPKTISVQLWEYNALGGLKLVMPGVLLVILFSFVSLAFWFWVTNLSRSSSRSRSRVMTVFRDVQHYGNDKD